MRASASAWQLCSMAGLLSGPCMRTPARVIMQSDALPPPPDTSDGLPGGGTHGSGSRFMSMSTATKGPAPMLLAIAGAYPGVTGAQITAVSPLPLSPEGGWNYHRLTSDACPNGFVAVEGTSLASSRPNIVALVVRSDALAVALPGGEIHEILALIDRSDPAMADPLAIDPREFYALADENDLVHIRCARDRARSWEIFVRRSVPRDRTHPSITRCRNAHAA